MRKLSQVCALALLYPLWGVALCAGFLAAGDSLVDMGEGMPVPVWSDAGCFPELPDFTMRHGGSFEQTASYGARRVSSGESQDGFSHPLLEVFSIGRPTVKPQPRTAHGFRRAGRSPPSR